MYSVDNNKIKLTRGDTLRLEVVILRNNEVYVPTENDSIRFAMKRNTINGAKTGYIDKEPLILKTIPYDTLILQLDPEDTKPFSFDTYAYDIEITFEDGTVDTFVKSTITLTPEVH